MTTFNILLYPFLNFFYTCTFSKSFYFCALFPKKRKELGRYALFIFKRHSKDEMSLNEINRVDKLTDELVVLCRNVFSSIVTDIYKSTKKHNRDHNMLLRDFQGELKDVSTWSRSRIKHEADKLRDIRGIHSIISEIYRLNKSIYTPLELDFDIDPKLDIVENFTKNACLNVARDIWRKPHLVYEIIDRKQLTKFQEMLDTLITTNIRLSVRRRALDDDEVIITPNVPSNEDYVMIEDIIEAVKAVEAVKANDEVLDIIESRHTVKVDEICDEEQDEICDEERSNLPIVVNVPIIESVDIHCKENTCTIVPVYTDLKSQQASRELKSIEVSDVDSSDDSDTVLVESDSEEDTSEMSEDSIPRIKNIKINKHKKNYKNSLEKYNNYYKASTNNLILNKKKMNESANKRSSFFQK